MDKKRLPLGVKLGYSSGMIGECLALNTFYFYFVFFLTEAAGISAALAGTIASVVTLVGAFTDLIAGIKSDYSTNKKGRRRPFIIKASVVLGIATILLYTSPEFLNGTMKVVYFIVIGIIFWTCVSFTDIPYISLGSELTDDYEEGNQIRAISNIFNYGGMILAASGTLVIVTTFSSDNTTSDPKGWSVMAIIFGIAIVAVYMLSAASTKGREPAVIEGYNPKQNNMSFIKDIIDIFKIKAYRTIILITIFGYGGVMLFTSIAIYYTTVCVGMTTDQIATLNLVMSIIVIIVSAIIGALGTKIIDKKHMVFLAFLLIIIACIVGKLVGYNPHTIYILYAVLAFVVSVYFIQIYSMVYDICSLDEFVNEKSRDGILVSVFYFIGKIVASASMFVVGWILSFSGYDATAAVQGQSVVTGIENGAMILTAILFAISCIFCLIYPINRNNFMALQNALEKKRNNQEYTTEGFEELCK